LDRCIRDSEDLQALVELVTAILKNAITCSMTDEIRCIGAGRQRCRRPDLTSILVTQVNGLARRVTDRIVMPGGESVLTAIDCPGATHAGLRNKESELRVGDYIGPWCRSPLAALEIDNIFAS